VTADRESLRKRGLVGWLLTGWSGAGHLLQLWELWSWHARLSALAALLTGWLSLREGAWGVVAFACSASLILAVWAYVRVQSLRPQVRLRITMRNLVKVKPPHEHHLWMFVEHVNNGRPSALTDWTVTAHVGSRDFKLETWDLEPDRLMYGAPGGKVVIAPTPGVALVRDTLAPAPSGTVRSGWICLRTPDMDMVHLMAPDVDFTISCHDTYGRKWSYSTRGRAQTKKGRPAPPGVHAPAPSAVQSDRSPRGPQR
jgi:hypothetical protein